MKGTSLPQGTYCVMSVQLAGGAPSFEQALFQCNTRESCKHGRKRACTTMHAHTHTHTYRTHAHTHAHTHTYTHTCTHTRTHTHEHTHTHTHTHTHEHTHTRHTVNVTFACPPSMQPPLGTRRTILLSGKEWLEYGWPEPYIHRI